MRFAGDRYALQGYVSKPSERRKYHSVLSFEDAVEARNELAIRPGDRNVCRELAQKFGVKTPAIRKIRAGKNWKHIKIQ